MPVRGQNQTPTRQSSQEPTQRLGQEPTHRLRDIFLRPGEYAVGDARHRIRTVLGSCVSVTLWCPQLRVGAMSHALLATRSGVPGSAGGGPDARYGDEALGLMLAGLASKGISGAQCEAKVFGGGDMFSAQKATGALAIGRRNGEAARELLLAHGIEVKSASLFGDGHRQILFDLASGDVWVRQLAPAGSGSHATAATGEKGSP